MRSKRRRLNYAHVLELSFTNWDANLLEFYGVRPEVAVGSSGFKFVVFICIVNYLSSCKFVD